MRRLWFKAEMKKAIKDGKKSGTTRIKPLKVNRFYQAVSGSRYDAKPFALLLITSRREIDDLVLHCTRHFKEEGFPSSAVMAGYLRAKFPQYLTTRPLYYHRFKIL